MLTKKLYNRYRQPIKLYWWRYDHPSRLNFGDELTPLIIKSLFGRRCVWSSAEKCDIAGAGSIIEVLLKNKKKNRPILWGSGFIKKGHNTISSDDFNINALRGKFTLSRTVDVSKETVALGDPGLLADCLVRSVPKKKYHLGIVPHYVDLELPIVKDMSQQKKVKIINPLSPPEEVINDIAASKCILSSSMHGLIVADSMGTPNAHFKLSDGLTGGLYKFQDYYSAFSGPSRHILLKSSDVLGMPIEAVAQKVEQLYKKPRNLDTLKQGLVKSFPY